MKKIFCLCLACLFAYVSAAQARVEFITKDSAITFKSPNSAGCKSGETNYGGRCIPTCSKSIYPFEKAPDAKKGVVEPCSEIKTRYRYTDCNPGYEWNTNKTDCILADCSGYPVTKDGLEEDAGSYEPCQSGDTTTYRYTNCNRGWNKQGNLCVANICSSGYPNDYDAIKPDDKVGHYDFCYSRKKTFWGYTDCLGEDKELYQGACYNKCTGFNSMVDAIEGCKVSKPCVSKAGTRFKCTECDESKGYDKEPTDGKCVISCTFTNQQLPTGCLEAPSCKRNGITYYDTKCTKCDTNQGYNEQPKDGVCEIITCPTGQINPDIYWCDDSWRCLMPAN